MEKGGLKADKDPGLKKSIKTQKEQDELPSYRAAMGDQGTISAASASKLPHSEKENHASAPSIKQPPGNLVSSAPSVPKDVKENFVQPTMPLPIVQQPVGRSQISQQPITQQAGFENSPSTNSMSGLSWMPAPYPNNVPDDCLVGLERLEHVDEIILQHKMDTENRK